VKYVVVQGEGMADRPLEELGGKTPLDAARTPNLDRMASRGILGMTPTVPKGLPAGSDVGTMSVLGYDPQEYHTGRSPIEAAGMGVALGAGDVAFRCNLVTVEASEEGDVLRDFAAGHIRTEEARRILEDLAQTSAGNGTEFHAGLGYRHLLVWRDGIGDMTTVPPHDITGRPIAEFLPSGHGAERLRELMDRSRDLLRDHAVNIERRSRGELAATQIWLWGQGTRLEVPAFKARFGLDGAVIAAVDLVNGLGVLAGFDRIRVPGVTGDVDTDYVAKAEYGLRALADHNFLLLHVEAPDEASHMGDVQAKVRAIEAIDELVLGRMLDGLPQFGDWRLMVLPGHSTLCSSRTHADEPVPFTVYSSTDLVKAKGPARRYTEADARDHGIFIPEAHTLMERFLRR
jgi:2,3-bisphosphoglycerate-independent phosphoglycerate mutase